MFTRDELLQSKSRKDLVAVAKKKGISLKKQLTRAAYEEELLLLQTELTFLLEHIRKKDLRVAVIFEGRDAAGKGGSIKRFVQHLNPHHSGVVALTKPTDIERGQWYFQRYVEVLPNRSNIRFFDRSWYNRAVVEPVMGFCSPQQYETFMAQVPSFEHMLHEDGIRLIKFWFDITKKEQKRRFEGRVGNPLKEWKFSPVDMEGQKLWDKYTGYKERMFMTTHTAYSPWVIVETNDKRTARLEALRYVLNQFDYPHKGDSGATLTYEPNVVSLFYRKKKHFNL